MATFDLQAERNRQMKVNQQIRQATSGRKASPARLAAIAASKRFPRVRVLPASPELREVLKHPNGMGFRSEGSVEWPLDNFTFRRLREGSITVEKPVEEQPQRAHRSTHRTSE